MWFFVYREPYARCRHGVECRPTPAQPRTVAAPATGAVTAAFGLAERFFQESHVELCRLPMPEGIIHYDLKEFSSARSFEESERENHAGESCSCQHEA